MKQNPAPDPSSVSAYDPVWERLREEAEAVIAAEPALSGLLLTAVLDRASLEDAVMHRIAQRLDNTELPADVMRGAFRDVMPALEGLSAALRSDLVAVLDRDPACNRLIEALLYFKGFHAIQTHRFAHALYTAGRRDLAFVLQSMASSAFQVDIHPAVRIGKGLFLDHATGVVVGETASIDDDVSILHSVTLGGTGKAGGDRHPKIRCGVLIGAGAKILGNIEIGHCTRVAAGSVVLADVPPNKTVAGVPAKVVGDAPCAEPSQSMDQLLASTNSEV